MGYFAALVRWFYLYIDLVLQPLNLGQEYLLAVY